MKMHGRSTHLAVWRWLLAAAAGMLWAVASDALELRDISLQSTLYSEVTLTATVVYDGALGETVMFGATAVGDGEVRGTGFRPVALAKGTSSIALAVSRPEVEGLARVVSKQLQLLVYSRETHQEKRVDFVIEWPGFQQHFDVREVAGARRLTSVRTLALNERLDGGRGLIAALVGMGIAPDGIELSAADLPAGVARQVALVLPETTPPDDLDTLLDLLRDTGLALSKIEFVPLTAEDFRAGHVVFARPERVSTPPLPEALLERLAQGAAPLEVYAHYGIKPLAAADLGARLLDKAIALNDLGTRAGSVEAERILAELAAADYRNPRVYEQLARAYSRIGGVKEAADQQRAVLTLSLQKFPNNHWAHAYLVFLETELGNYPEAFEQLAAAQKHAKQSNIWLTVYAGRLHQAVGDHNKAAQILKPLLALNKLSDTDDRARYYGLVAYAGALWELQSSEVAAIYDAIITAYPERGACNKLDLARYWLLRELDAQRSAALLDHADTRTCRGGKQLRALVALLEWQRGAGSQAALTTIALDYGEMADLILQAAQFKHADRLLAAMIRHGVAIDTLNRYGYSALHLAAQQAHARAAISLMRAGAAVDLKSGDGLTPLMLAVTSSRIEPVRALLDAGADRHIKSSYGFTALELAHSFDNDAVIAALAGKPEA